MSPVSGKDCATCQKCFDDATVIKCKECTCQVCYTKDPDKDHLTLMCDECEYFYHTFCLDPPLDEVPGAQFSRYFIDPSICPCYV